MGLPDSFLKIESKISLESLDIVFQYFLIDTA